MKRGGGFVPNEVTSPARSLNPVRVRSLGRRRHRTASPFPRRVGEEKRRAVLGLLFPKLGSHSAFLLERDRGSSEKRRARGVHAGTSERAGLVSLVRHEAASLFQTDSSPTVLTPATTEMSSRVAAASNLATPNYRRARQKRTRPCMGTARSPPLQPSATPFPGNGECPH